MMRGLRLSAHSQRPLAAGRSSHNTCRQSRHPIRDLNEKGPRRGPFRQKRRDVIERNQLSAFCTLVNVVLSLEPSPCTVAIMATEMPAAISPYSIAVAPDSSFRKRLTMAMRISLPLAHHVL